MLGAKGLNSLEEALGVRFRDRELFQLALVHSSYLNENLSEFGESNERLEFLGDAVVGMATAEELYAKNLHWREGKLTQARAVLVKEATLAEAAQRLGLGALFLMGRGEESGGGRQRASNLSSGLEAVIGALFLDQGYNVAKQVVLRVLADNLIAVEEPQLLSDPKSALQEAIQAQGFAPPTYLSVSEEGADHERTFIAEVTVDGRVVGKGEGKRKSQAEQAAAALALENIAIEG